jgi:hypothetical protein
MKKLHLTQEAEKTLNSLANAALKGAGVEAYALVKQLEAWLLSATEESVAPSESSPNVPAQ